MQQLHDNPTSGHFGYKKMLLQVLLGWMSLGHRELVSMLKFVCLTKRTTQTEIWTSSDLPQWRPYRAGGH